MKIKIPQKGTRGSFKRVRIFPELYIIGKHHSEESKQKIGNI